MTSARDFAIKKMSRQSHKLESLTSSLRCTHPQAQGASSCPEYRGHRESPDKVSHVCRKQKNGSKIENRDKSWCPPHHYATFAQIPRETAVAVALEPGSRYFGQKLLWFPDGANCEPETAMIGQTAWPGQRHFRPRTLRPARLFPGIGETLAEDILYTLNSERV